MGYLAVSSGSITINGRRYAVGVHEVDKSDEEAVKAAANEADHLEFSDKKPKDTPSTSFVAQDRKRFPELGGIMTWQQRRDLQTQELINEGQETGTDQRPPLLGDRSITEAEQADLDTKSPAVTGETLKQGEHADAMYEQNQPEAIVERVVKN